MSEKLMYVTEDSRRREPLSTAAERRRAVALEAAGRLYAGRGVGADNVVRSARTFERYLETGAATT